MIIPGIEFGMEESIAPPLTASIQVGGEEVIQRIAGQWRSLCEETRSAPFHRPEWIQTYLRAFEPDGEVVLLTASAGNSLVAVLPLVRKRCWYAGVPLIKLAGAANVHSVRFELLRKEGAMGKAALRSIWGLLKSTPMWQLLELPVFPQDGACHELMALAGGEGFSTITFLGQDSPILRMQRDGNGRLTWLGGTTRHFRHELRRKGRLLEQEAGDKLKLICRVEPHPETLHKFYEMEAAGWKGVEGSAINCDRVTRSFYDTIAREAASRGYFRLHSLEVNGRMTAAAFSVMTDDCLYPMKITYDESLRYGGPGQLLLNGILQECAEKEIAELFFGGDKDYYKTSWTPETLPHFNGFVFNKHFRAQLVYRLRSKLLSPLGRYRRRMLEKWRIAKIGTISRHSQQFSPRAGNRVRRQETAPIGPEKEKTPCR
ncbi:MAG: GNAT family N-acetyltransferase [Candidatus Angelobacter sp.]